MSCQVLLSPKMSKCCPFITKHNAMLVLDKVLRLSLLKYDVMKTLYMWPYDVTLRGNLQLTTAFWFERRLGLRFTCNEAGFFPWKQVPLHPFAASCIVECSLLCATYTHLLHPALRGPTFVSQAPCLRPPSPSHAPNPPIVSPCVPLCPLSPPLVPLAIWLIESPDHYSIATI